MSELTAQSLTTLCRLIQTRAVSPVPVLEAHLERIEQVNPGLNAIVTLAPDAMEKARAAERAINNGEVWGPLHGIPITVKDTIETAGLLSTSGSLTRANFVPERDATAVARLKAAGAIILGKTNAAEMAMDYTADNPVFGRTNHPQDPSLTPGGSSGGEAAAIAAFMSPGGIGSDLAGSVRVPAHFCGIAGLRPTVGRIPGEGQCPPARGPYGLGSVIGPMARSVEDLQLLFRVLAGERPVQEPTNVRGLHVAWYTDDSIATVSSETATAVRTAADALSRAGLKTEEARPPGVERGNELWLRMFSRTTVVVLRTAYEGREHEGGDFVCWRLATADDTPAPSMDDYIQTWLERDQLREELLRWMKDKPLLIAPVGSSAAVPHGTLKVQSGDQKIGMFRAFSYAQAFTVFDLPVVVVNAGKTKEGLPIGVQIAGRPNEEETVLAAARIVEELI
ncbi:MAG TPA: amidase [Pyrinomonadaceae bacterium]|nr:amidase [Pyrinomonadaceae bacterium]